MHRGLQRVGPGRLALRNKALGLSRARPLGLLTGQRTGLKNFLRPMAQPTG